jgi:TRAP-type C4-dicarboxylate transport system substrate-binding protein
MKTKTWLALLSVLLVIGLILGGCAEPTPAPSPSPSPSPSPEPAKPIELKLSWVATGSEFTEALYGVWINNVEERTGGRVHITEYVAGQLVPPPETYDAVISGVHDIGVAWIGVTPGRFPQAEVIQMTRIGTVCPTISSKAWELYQTTPEIQKEFADVKMLSMAATTTAPPASGLGFADKEVRTMEDLKGLKVHGVGKWGLRMVEALGAAPVPAMPQDMYTDLQRKIIDGAVIDPGQFDELKLREVVHYFVEANIHFMSMYVAMNWDSWNSLPPDIQQIFEEEAAKIPNSTDTHKLEANAAALKTAIDDYGLKVITLTPEELARWQKAQDTVRGEWVAELEAQGMPGKKLLEHLDNLLAEYLPK